MTEVCTGLWSYHIETCVEVLKQVLQLGAIHQIFEPAGVARQCVI